jgi:hypothetical protein
MALARPFFTITVFCHATPITSAATLAVQLELPMRKLLAVFHGRPFQLYLLGYGFILAGAWAMSAFQSMVPMALGASAALMLATPLLQHLVRRAIRPVRDVNHR